MNNNGMEATLTFAQGLDLQDPLNEMRKDFYFPKHGSGEAIYFCGNSLGLQPKNTQACIEQELKDWRELGVGGYLHGKNPWLYYQHGFAEQMSRIAGCETHEVTVMNTLTVNLHLMLLSFYNPEDRKHKILMEKGAFPSDQYAVETQIRFHGFDPEEAIIEVGPGEGKKIIEEEEIIEAIEKNKDSLSLVLLGGINYYSGQLFDMRTITEEAHRCGVVIGFDLAHAMGNAPLDLHEWNIDFAVWCSYKYLNGGPGAVGGLFVHERHARNINHPRMGGWWGNQESLRFQMEKGFIPKADASGWNISTAQVFNMVSLKASLELFEKTGMVQLRAKSELLTGYLEFLLGDISHLSFEIITPAQFHRRGAQLSLFFREKGKQIHEAMTAAGIVVDYREPGVIRVAPAPIYNSFEDLYRFYEILKTIL